MDATGGLERNFKLSRAGRIVSRFQALVPLRRDPEVEKAIQETVRELGRELRKFTRVTRERLGVNDPDVVIRAFPELFAEPVVSDEGPHASQALV